MLVLFTSSKIHMSKTYLCLQLIIIFLCSSITLDLWLLYILPNITDIPIIDFAISGRWFMMILSGKLFTTSIINEPAVKHELLIGLSGIHLVGLIYSAFFIFICGALKVIPSIYSGFLYGMALIVFPFFVLHPSMGMGIMALNSPLAGYIILRTFLIHSAYGCGIALGVFLSVYLLKSLHNCKAQGI